MNGTCRRFITAAGLALGLALPAPVAFADSDSFRELSAEWWQWAYSLPVAVNPILDETGAYCVLGQRGSTWFLAGSTGGGPVVRDCSVPEGVDLFLPIINAAFFDSPGTCGQGPDSIPIREMRAAIAAFVNGATDVALEIDGEPVPWRVRRSRSEVFAVALPEDNFAGCPAGIYSPAVADGYWARVHALDPGEHTLAFRAENPDFGFVIDVTYHLHVVPGLAISSISMPVLP